VFSRKRGDNKELHFRYFSCKIIYQSTRDDDDDDDDDDVKNDRIIIF